MGLIGRCDSDFDYTEDSPDSYNQGWIDGRQHTIKEVLNIIREHLDIKDIETKVRQLK